MDHYWCCDCGHEWLCSPDDLRAGAVVECTSCKKIWAGVRPRDGRPVKWIELDRATAVSPYYDLLREKLVDEQT